MLATVKSSLAYVEYVMLVAYTVALGILLIPKTIVGALAVFFCAVIMILMMLGINYTKYSLAKRLCSGKPYGNLFMDVVMLLYSIQYFYEFNEWGILYTIGTIFLSIDTLLFVIGFIERRYKKQV